MTASAPPQPPRSHPRRSTWIGLVRAAIDEDVGPGDVTSHAVVPQGLVARARIEAREPLLLCGLELAREVFGHFDVTLDAHVADGDTLGAGERAATVSGPARGILAAERTALNFLQHLSGIATLTHAFGRAVAGTRAAVVDTRKTTPGWRTLEKYAVRCGGGVNHRVGLFDGILIKDNHIAATGPAGAAPAGAPALSAVADAVKRARESGPAGLRIQIEVESLEAARAALDAGAEALLIDNQPPEVLREIVAFVAGRVPLEATGGVTLESVAGIARTGVDRISIGALTHSAPAVDLALEWDAHSAT